MPAFEADRVVDPCSRKVEVTGDQRVGDHHQHESDGSEPADTAPTS